MADISLLNIGKRAALHRLKVREDEALTHTLAAIASVTWLITMSALTLGAIILMVQNHLDHARTAALIAIAASLAAIAIRMPMP